MDFLGSVLILIYTSRCMHLLKIESFNNFKLLESRVSSIGRQQDTRVIYISQMLYYIPEMNKWNVKLNAQYHLH